MGRSPRRLLTIAKVTALVLSWAVIVYFVALVVLLYVSCRFYGRCL